MSKSIFEYLGRQSKGTLLALSGALWLNHQCNRLLHTTRYGAVDLLSIACDDCCLVYRTSGRIGDSMPIYDDLFLCRWVGQKLSAPWPVGFSIGAVTFVTLPDSTDTLLAQADQIMYAVKRSGKNRLECQQYSHTLS